MRSPDFWSWFDGIAGPQLAHRTEGFRKVFDRALGRDDLGRMAPGARADFLMVDIEHPAMQPLYDPVRSLLYAAGERAIRHVFVGGQQIVRDGKALAFDYADASARLQMAQRRAIEKVPGFDWAGRGAAEIMPPTFRSK